MTDLKTPGVFVTEINAFPSSIVQVATAVPAFIGYTEKALTGQRSLQGQPVGLSSLREFEFYFGGPARPMFNIVPHSGPATGTVSPLDEAGMGMKDTTLTSTFVVTGSGGDTETFRLEPVGEEYCLYGAMRLFFANGGGPCMIVSIGSYDDPIDAEDMLKAINALEQEQAPTMVVIPETTRLTRDDSIKVQQHMLAHCGTRMKNRFALLDIFAGHLDVHSGNPVKAFRDKLGNTDLDYGAAYYPWVNTSVYSPGDFTYENLTREGRDTLITLLKQGVSADQHRLIALLAAPPELPVNTVATSVKTPVTIETGSPEQKIDEASVRLSDADAASGDRVRTVDNVGVWTLEADGSAITFVPDPAFLSGTAEIRFSARTTDGTDLPERVLTVIVQDAVLTVSQIDGLLRKNTRLYNEIMTRIAIRLNTMPPSAAMAGIYTMVDGRSGVWNAPANVSLGAALSPTVTLSNEDQEDLTVTPQGTSINALRSFAGRGMVVWGARTLDGNSPDWRYIPVRRTAIMIQESIRLAIQAFVFEPNISTTWVNIRSMIENFLTNIWKAGGLAGSSPREAFGVRVGLGETMTAEDLSEGVLRISVLVAFLRPAEFTVITVLQQMPKS